MKTGIFIAAVLHLAFILFGGIFFFSDDTHAKILKDIEIVKAEDVTTKKEEKKELTKEQQEVAPQEEAPPPDADQVAEQMDRQQSAAVGEVRLEALDLSQLANALNNGASGTPGWGGGPGADALQGGGVIGGTRAHGATAMSDKAIDDSFTAAEIDQRPRVLYQASPVFPAELRGKKMDGQVSVIFIVSPEGKVLSYRVEKSSHPAFEQPALEAVRQWKYEPGLKSGKPVACKMRVSIRFERS